MLSVFWDGVCGVKEPFWDSQATWNSSVPDFPHCFQKTVLIWVPCSVLWIISPVAIYNILHSRSDDVPWTKFKILKLMLCLFLFLLDFSRILIIQYFDSVNDKQSLDVIASAVKMATMMLACLLLWKGWKIGAMPTAILLFFWFCFFTSEALIFYSNMKMVRHAEPIQRFTEKLIVLIDIIYFPTVVTQFCLSLTFDDFTIIPDGDKAMNQNREQRSTIISKILFIWYDRLALLGYKRPLEVKDLGTLKYENSCAGVLSKFDVILEKVSQSSKCEVEKSRKKDAVESKTFLLGESKVPPKLRPFLLRSVIETFGFQLAFVLFLKLICDVVTYSNPLVLSRVILFVSSKEPTWHGYMYAMIFAMIRITEALLDAHFIQSASVLSLKVRTALMSYIYRKALRMSTNAKNETNVGEIVNLMAVDINKIMLCVENFAHVVSIPLQLCIAMFELYLFMGPSSLVSLVIICALQGITTVTAAFHKRAQVIKMFAWEEAYQKYIQQFRNEEITQLKKIGTIQTLVILVWSSSSNMISLGIFTVFILIDNHNVLDASKAFVALTILELFRRPLLTFPFMVTHVIEGIVSMQRLNKFSFCEEIKPDDAQTIHSKDFAIQIKNGNFSWKPDLLPNLFGINLAIPKGSIVAIVGNVGSGKSSLLFAMLGEMNRLKGTVAIEDRIAYGAQIPWIQNATLRDNILFGNEMEEARYWNVLEACALLPDLEMLPAGDMTEIGEKGINLSGGQKQRVSLARAIYFDASTYLLDDPLSAVDAYVGKHIFDNVIGPNGLLKNKTRVLVTHSLTYLPEVDSILVVTNGTITEAGSYKELIKKQGAFSELIDFYTNNKDGVTDKVASLTAEVDIANASRVPEIDRMQSQMRAKLVKTEDAQVGKVRGKVYYTYIRMLGWHMITFTVTVIVVNILRAESSIWLSAWSNDHLHSDGAHDVAKRNYRLGIYGGICFLLTLFQGLNSQSFICGIVKAATSCHFKMLEGVVRAPQWFFDTTPIGRILNRFSSDIGTIDVQLPLEIRSLVSYTGTFLVSLFIIIFKMPWMIIAAVIFICLFYLIQAFNIASGRQLRRLDSITKSPIYSLFSESINGSKTIRAYKCQSSFFKELTSKIDENTLCVYLSSIAQRWLIVRLEIVGAMMLFGSSAFAVARRESFDPGTIGLILNSTIMLATNLKFLFNYISSVETNIVSVERVMEYNGLPQEATPQVRDKSDRRNKWLKKGVIEFRNYATRYREELDTVLKGITCTIREEEKVGIVGRTGAGKSSLTLALFRIIEPVEGTIFIDGQDIVSLDLADLRKNLTIIPQDPVLFPGTMRMNLDPFQQFSDEAVWKALELAHLKTFVLSQPSKLDHPISEGGENLSVGQRQLVCLARALLKKTKILILDEATAAVDVETDTLIQTTIRQEFHDCTVLTIAHRLNTVMDSDRIMVLDKGRVVEFDTPAKLLTNDSVFYGMAKDAGLV